MRRIDTEARKARMTVLFYLGLLAVILGAAAYQSRFVLFRPWTVRAWTAMAGTADSLYLAGGRGASGAMLDDLLVVDTRSMRLRRAARLPAPMIGSAAVTAGGRVFILGGYDGASPRGEILSYDPARHGIGIVGLLPTPRAFGAAAAAGGLVYYIGGWDGARILDDIVVFDPATGTARSAGRIPQPRQYAAALALDGRILVLGGETAGGAYAATVLELDAASLATLREVPAGRTLYRPRAALVRGTAVCFEGRADGPRSVLSSLDTATFAWTGLLDGGPPNGEPDMALAQSGGALYLAGGAAPRWPGQIGFYRIVLPPGAGGARIEDVRLRSFNLF